MRNRSSIPDRQKKGIRNEDDRMLAIEGYAQTHAVLLVDHQTDRVGREHDLPLFPLALLSCISTNLSLSPSEGIIRLFGLTTSSVRFRVPKKVADRAKAFLS